MNQTSQPFIDKTRIQDPQCTPSIDESGFEDPENFEASEPPENSEEQDEDVVDRDLWQSCCSAASYFVHTIHFL